jgi:hypothetical protein
MVEAPEAPEPPEPLKPPVGKPERPRNRTLEWFSRNPVFGLVGFLVGVVSLGATVYFGLEALKSRDLSLLVNPAKTTIVKAGQSSDLHVLYKGQSVSTDVTALQVEIWNAGKESIRPEHILSPIILQMSPKVPILEVRLRRISRPVCQIALDESQLADGKLGVSWRILEHNDGAIIQLIVAGPSGVTVAGQGSVEGDPTVRLTTARRSSWASIGNLIVLLSLSIVLLLSFRSVRHTAGEVGHLKAKEEAFERELGTHEKELTGSPEWAALQSGHHELRHRISYVEGMMRLFTVLWWVAVLAGGTSVVMGLIDLTSSAPLLFD